MKTKLSILATSLACFAAVAPTTARADAIAQSILDISAFSASLTNGATVSATNISNSYSQSAGVTGFGSTGNVPFPVSNATPCTSLDPANCADLNPGLTAAKSGSGTYTPFTALTGTAAAGTGSNIASALSSITGSTINGGANAREDSTVSLVTPATGGATTSAGLTANLELTIPGGASNSQVTFTFTALPFLRAYLGQNNVKTQATYSMNIVIKNAAGATVFTWSPDGLIDSAANDALHGIALGSEVDPFTLNQSVSKNSFGSNGFGDGTTTYNFSVTSAALAAGTYDIGITGTTFATAQFNAPEPTSLALIGMGMMGLGLGRRQRKLAAKREA